MAHTLTLEERKRLKLTGAVEVISFEENQVLLNTALGLLRIHGQELKLKNLSPEGGRMAVEGQIAALIYEQGRSGGWLSRLFG